MNKKRNLSKELNMKNCFDNTPGTLDVRIDRIKDMVDSKIDSASMERKSNPMKSKKKISLIAIAATLALGVTVFAASGIVTTWFSSSSSNPEYKSLPSAEQVKSDIGYEPVLIDTFENGYTFKDGSVINNNLADESGNSVEKFKSVSFEYEKDGDRVIFSQDKFNSEMDAEGKVISTVSGTDIYYFSYTNKIVPPDYKMTDDDKKAEENGELVFSYGSSKVEISEVQSVTWRNNGIQYQLLQIDGKLSAKELVDMAAEVIR